MRQTIATLATLAAFAVATTASAGEVMVHLRHNKVDPAEVSVGVGDTVVFHNLDAMPGGHSVKADDGSFQSPGLDKDAAWKHTFTEPGRHPFHIVEHPSAKGVIVVKK